MPKLTVTNNQDITFGFTPTPHLHKHPRLDEQHHRLHYPNTAVSPSHGRRKLSPAAAILILSELTQHTTRSCSEHVLSPYQTTNDGGEKPFTRHPRNSHVGPKRATPLAWPHSHTTYLVGTNWQLKFGNS
ncbi:hypothetical protein GWK47_052813 [Chionoecetes opilio]|uniref:Uncharacterized protein n=1 Tax=Chionoecetes opilio TaxID=41210 RepID=A0A8J4Y1F5_CHIOP|nr:hypothetical protein GWK47_052813 [Chionoecetes opilio]